MQKADDGTIIVSATDLVGYLACDHLSSLELGRIEGRWEKPPGARTRPSRSCRTAETPTRRRTSRS